MLRFIITTALILPAAFGLAGPTEDDKARLASIWVREGFELTVAENTIERPRFLEEGPGGVVFVSLPEAGEIRRLADKDGDGFYETSTIWVEKRQSVHAMQWHMGELWFTTTGAILRSRDTNDDGTADEVAEVIGDEVLPSRGGHWWRSLLIHKDGIYTSIGDSGNIEDETGTKRQKVWRYSLDGSGEKLWSSGVRNTEKLVVRPGTDEVWGMDHGSDNFGGVMERKEKAGQPITDLNPPCEMNRYDEGGFYGHPFIVGNKLPRYEFMRRPDITSLAASTVPPKWSTGAHWAPNAMEFYDGDAIPGARGDAFVAYHGSWNRSEKGGYCVTRVYFENGLPWGERKYVNFLPDGRRVLGRPVDVLALRDGSLLISDDGGNRIYRLRARAEAAK